MGLPAADPQPAVLYPANVPGYLSWLFCRIWKKVLYVAGDKHWDISFEVMLFYRHTASSATELAIQEISLQMAAGNQIA